MIKSFWVRCTYSQGEYVCHSKFASSIKTLSKDLDRLKWRVVDGNFRCPKHQNENHKKHWFQRIRNKEAA